MIHYGRNTAKRLVNAGVICVDTHASGIVDFPLQSCCRAALASDQDIPSGPWTKLNLVDTSDWDIQGEFDNANHRWVAEEDGKVQVNANGYILALDDGDYAALVVEKNGALVGAFVWTVACALNAAAGLSASDIIDVSAGDFLEVFVIHNFGANRTADAQIFANYLTVIKVV